MNWDDFTPVDPTTPKTGKVDWSQFEPIKKDDSDLSRGFKESFQQLPQLAYGVGAGLAAAGESAFGEGGMWTGAKKAAVEGYQRWGDKIASNAKESDSFNYSFDQAKQGNFGALVDWLQHGIGYVGGQGLQMLATAGIGSALGKLTAGTAAKTIAEGMVAKEAAKIGAEAAGKLTADEIAKQATAAVAQKFATFGANAAVGAAAFGQEGGEIFGDLTQEATKQGRALTGDELAKAFGATLAAGGLEFVGDKLGLDIVLGKSKLLKPTEAMTGLTGRLARGAVAAAGAAPIEAGTEYGQTLAEEYGKGKDPFSPESLAQAKDAAALGALGGTVIGGGGGMLHGAKAIEPKPEPKRDPVPDILGAGNVDDAIKAATEATRGPVGMLALPDTEVTPEQAIMRMEAQAQRDSRLNVSDWSALANTTQAEPEADWMQEARATAAADQQQIADEQRIRSEALAPTQQTTTLPEASGNRTWESDLGRIAQDAAEARAQQQKAADLERMPADVAAQNAQAQAVQRAATLDGESPMAAALRRAGAAPTVAGAAESGSGAQSVPATGGTQPRIVPRAPDMQPMGRAAAEKAAAQAPGAEVVAIRNLSGKLAYTVLPPERAAIRPTDIKTADGYPYGTRAAALIRAKKEGEGFAPVEVPGGFVVRQEENSGNNPADDGRTGPAIGERSAGTELLPEQRPADVQPSPAGTESEGGTGIRPAGVPRDAGRPDLTLSVGDTFSQNGKAWTVIESTPKLVRARDAEGATRMIAVGSKTWRAIEPNAAAPAQPSPAHVGVSSDAPSAPVAAAPANESDQDRSNREWRENYQATVAAEDLGKVSPGKIRQAINYAAKMASNLGPKAWVGDEEAKRLIDAFNREAELMKFHLKARGTASATQDTNAAHPAPQPQPAPSGETAGATGSAAPSAADWANEMARLRASKPRPIEKMYGSRGPTPEQAAEHEKATREWNSAYRKASSEQKKALERDNAEFRRRQAEQADPSPPAEAKGEPHGQGLQGRRQEEALNEQAASAAPQESAAATNRSTSETERGKQGGGETGVFRPAATLKERIAAKKGERPAELIALRKRESILRSLLECMK